LVIIFLSVVTVHPKAKIFHNNVELAHNVAPAGSIIFHINVVLAQKVVACVGIQKISQTEAQLITEIDELATVLSAQFILNIKVPVPSRIIHHTQIVAAHVIQYTQEL